MVMELVLTSSGTKLSTGTDMNLVRLAALLFLANAAPVSAVDSPTTQIFVTYRCVDNTGRATYTTQEEMKNGQACTPVSREVGVIPSPKKERLKKPWLGYGDGMKSCGRYLEDRRIGVGDSTTVEWFFGFVSAYNYYSPKQIKPSFEGVTVLAYLDKHCRNSPLSTLAVGMQELIKVQSK